MMPQRFGKARFGLIIILAGLASTAILAGSRDPEDHSRMRRYPRIAWRGQRINSDRPVRVKAPLYSPSQVLVKFQPKLSAQAIRSTMALYGSKKIVPIQQIGIYKVGVPPQTSVTEFLASLGRNPDIQRAEPDLTVRIQDTPNDAFFPRQYSLHNLDKPGADIEAEDAWHYTKGDPDVIIAVVDTGVDLNHPDIKNKIVSPGRDFVNNDEDATDDHWHGTHVAGIAAAETNNLEGIAGVAWNCRILPVKVIDSNGFGNVSQVIEGIIWAADHNAQVINLSIGANEPSDSLLAVLKYAYDKNVVLVAAAGNDNSAVLYPAAYDAYCLAVAATDSSDIRAPWSNHGPEVDVAAPGNEVLSLVPTWYFGPDAAPYGYASGTSMATPHVAGFAALLRSLKPWLKVPEIMNIIRYSSDDVNAADFLGSDNFIGYGRINMKKALSPFILKKDH